MGSLVMPSMSTVSPTFVTRYPSRKSNQFGGRATVFTDVGQFKGSTNKTHLLNLSAQLLGTLGGYQRKSNRLRAKRKAGARFFTCSSAVSVDVSLAEAEAVRINDESQGAVDCLPGGAGVYAVYNSDMELKYVGMSRRIGATVQAHADALPDQAVFVKVCEMERPSNTDLQTKWKTWIREHGSVPAGNKKGETAWVVKTTLAKKPVPKPMDMRHVDPLENMHPHTQNLITARVLEQLLMDGFMVLDGVVDSDIILGAEKEAGALQQAGYMEPVGGGVQKSQGRHDEVLVFNTAKGGSGANSDNLVIGVKSKGTGAAKNKGMQTEQLSGDEYKSLVEVAKVLKGIPYALQHRLALQEGLPTGAWTMPALAAPVNLMLAVYPGEGAHYVRHLDNDTEDPGTRLGPPGQRVCDREVTAIFYLNSEWEDSDGGNLCLQIPSLETTDESSESLSGQRLEIAPQGGRLVLFQSRLVEHEVLPAFRTRWAMSAWIPSLASFQQNK